jgi:hypothetical protein
MSVWDVNFDEVVPGKEQIAPGDYTLRLLGGSRNKYDQEAVDVKAKIVSEGAFHGETLFFKFPNPDKADKNNPGNSPKNWVVKNFKRFVMSLGVDIQAGEHPVDYLNRAGAEGAFFDATVVHRSYKDKETGDDKTTVDVPLAKLRPASQVAA